VTWLANSYSAGFNALTFAQASPLGVRNGSYAETATAPALVISVPSGLGFTNIVATFELEGYTGGTNFSMAIQFYTEVWTPTYTPTAGWLDVTGITNGYIKTVSATNSFASDSCPRNLYLGFGNISHAGNLTNRVYINRIHLRSL